MRRIFAFKTMAAMALLVGGVLTVPEIAAQPNGNPGARKDAEADSRYKGKLRGVSDVGLITDISGLESCSIPKRAIRDAFADALSAATLRVHRLKNARGTPAGKGLPLVTLSIRSNNMSNPWTAARPYNPYTHCLTCVELSVRAPVAGGNGATMWERKASCLLGPAQTVRGDTREYVRQATEHLIAHWKRDNAE